LHGHSKALQALELEICTSIQQRNSRPTDFYSCFLYSANHDEFARVAMKNTTAIFLLSLALILSACDRAPDPDDYYAHVSEVSSDPDIQAAYRGCIRKMVQDLVNDNQKADPDVLRMIIKPVPELCDVFVVKPCEKDRDSIVCTGMIEDYWSK